MEYNDLTRDSFMDFLSEKEINIISIDDGSNLLDKIYSEIPDMILLNVQISGIDAIETIYQIRNMKDKKLASLPIIALSTVIFPGKKERYLASGANEYFLKPISLQNFIELLQNYFENSGILPGLWQ